jgi:toxin ParE1/3/4
MKKWKSWIESGATVRVKWLQRARRNLDEEIAYLAEESPEHAFKVYNHIRARIAALEQFPNMGRPGRIMGTRELIVAPYPYIVPYRVKDNTIIILRVFHVSQKLPDQW